MDSTQVSKVRNLNMYDNIMNCVLITNVGRFWECFKFTLLTIKHKPLMCFGIMKYWVYRIVFGVENMWIDLD